MTEAEWLACDDPVRMVEFLRRRRYSDRKLRLFEVACCRRRARLFDWSVAEALAVVERYADHLATLQELLAARKVAGHANETLRAEAPERYAAYAVYTAARPTVTGPRAVN